MLTVYTGKCVFTPILKVHKKTPSILTSPFKLRKSLINFSKNREKIISAQQTKPVESTWDDPESSPLGLETPVESEMSVFPVHFMVHNRAPYLVHLMHTKCYKFNRRSGMCKVGNSCALNGAR